ncbi:MAG: cation-transporting P-type ATPase [Dysgonamonadaceae bacterium]|jgi:calcium-translocating P-type ATPase|nr:cation-transporting P-type ATPase [Dysgonamonadaceae bacterium]
MQPIQNDNPITNKWYTFNTAKVVSLLKTDTGEGLSDNEATNRLQKYGKNALPERKKESLVFKFLKQFNDIFIYILLGAAMITLAIGDYVETIVIVGVAVINAFIGFIQENKAEAALEGIRKMLSLKAHVIRNGKRTEIDASDLTVGDIVIISPGSKVPADLRLIRADNLHIEESALTGESVASEKNIEILPDDTVLGDRLNMAFSGTSVSTGTGVGIVVATGGETEIGKINQMMSNVETLKTPLLKQTAQFAKWLSIIILSGSVLIYIFGYFFRDYEPVELLLAIIGLAIAAVPEGLPAILSIILAIGVQNMAKRKSIVRTLPSVETLGSVSVICSDKTGTLTKNEMTVKTLKTKDGEYQVTGTGYAPEGDILINNTKVDFEKEPVLRELIESFDICNEASIGKDADGHWIVNGAPTEGSLVTVVQKANLNLPHVERISTIPFDSAYKYMATLVEKDTHNVIYIKGAPDRLLQMAKFEKTAAGEKPLKKEYWENEIHDIAIRGQRLIGAAYKIVPKSITAISHKDIQNGAVFLGLAGIIDPPREEVIASIKECKDAGITVKMITGDHADTARTIAKELGIGDGITALEGKELEAMTDAEMEEAVMNCDVFARTSPEHKLRLVKALQARGAICAMTGDGVNDAPALKQADIGVAMGIKGTEVTKDAAKIVLADDNFSTIVAAVEEGRRVYDNLKKTILFILPTNGAQAFIIIASILFGFVMPLTAVQILWVNMVIAVTVSLALAFEPLESGTMHRPPRSPKSPLLSNYFIGRVLFVIFLIGISTLWLNIYLLNKEADIEIVRTITLNAIVLAQMFHLFNCRSIRESAFKKGFFNNNAVWVVCGILIVLQLGITYLPFMNAAFATVPLEAKDWIFPFVLGVAVFLIVEVEKAIMRKIDKVKGRMLQV